MKNATLKICGVDVQPGERVTLALPTPEIYTCAPLHIPMHILHGKKEGPKLLICGTFHGDEVNGIAVIQRLLHLSSLKKLSGTLIAVPVMNVYGLINQTRLLPDGHDLEASFPGSETGSFAARLAYIFTHEILNQCTHYVQIRTGSPEHYKMPQVLYQEGDETASNLAKAFGAPLVLSQSDPVGFHHCEGENKRPALVYEAGEANRTDEWSIRSGVKGLTRIMRELGMVKMKSATKHHPFYEVSKMSWVRASGSGLFSLTKRVGSYVEKGETMGTVSDPFGTAQEHPITAPESGIIIEITTQPLVYEGQVVAQVGHYQKEKESALPIDVPSIQPDIISN